MSKICRSCGLEQPIESFARRGRGDQRRLDCNSCRGKRFRSTTERLGESRRRAIKYGVPFSITVDSVVWPTHCPILGIELNYGGSSDRRYSPSLDRIRPELGYVPGNVMVLSNRANAMKSDASFSELRKFAEWVLLNVPES